jgi:hypothetical protein
MNFRPKGAECELELYNTSTPEAQTEARNTLNLTTAQAKISVQQQELNQQKAENETQAKNNIALAKLGLNLAANNVAEKAQGVIKTVVGTVVGTGVGLLIGNAAAPVALIPELDFIQNPRPAEVQGTAQKETLTDLQKNVSGVLQDKYPGYNSLAKPYREYIEQSILVQGGTVNDTKGFPHSFESIQDTALKQGQPGQVTFSIPNQGDIHKILTFAFGNPENLNKTVPPYTMTQDQLTKTLNGN